MKLSNHIQALKPQISHKYFQKIDLRIGKIIYAENISDADKLIRLKVDIGIEIREIISGIKGEYNPENLIGKNILIVANIKPKKMRFGTSNGMLIVVSFPGYENIYNKFITSDFAFALPGMGV